MAMLFIVVCFYVFVFCMGYKHLIFILSFPLLMHCTVVINVIYFGTIYHLFLPQAAENENGYHIKGLSFNVKEIIAIIFKSSIRADIQSVPGKPRTAMVIFVGSRNMFCLNIHAFCRKWLPSQCKVAQPG